MGICESVLCGGHPSDLRRVREVQGLSTKTAVTRASEGLEDIENGGIGVITKTNGVLSSAVTGNLIPFVKNVMSEQCNQSPLRKW